MLRIRLFSGLLESALLLLFVVLLVDIFDVFEFVLVVANAANVFHVTAHAIVGRVAAIGVARLSRDVAVPVGHAVSFRRFRAAEKQQARCHGCDIIVAVGRST
jgi:hypothetical protein